jgi:hypothetical protein
MSDPTNGPHQGQQLLTVGKPLAEAKAAMVLLHGLRLLSTAGRRPHLVSFQFPGAHPPERTWHQFRFAGHR